MAIGDPTREHVTALIIIDFENVGYWAEKNGLRLHHLCGSVTKA